MSKVYWIDKDSIAIADTENRIDFSGPTAGTLSLHCSRHDSPMVSAESGAKFRWCASGNWHDRISCNTCRVP